MKIYIYLTYFIIILISCKKESFIDEQLIANQDNLIFVDEKQKELFIEVENELDLVAITVYLRFPEKRNEPLKSVVVMHGSGGMWKDKDLDGDGISDDCNIGELSRQSEEWSKLLVDNNFLVALPDSYSNRGTCENEGDYKYPPLKFKISGTFIRNGDAYAVLELLKKMVWKDTNLSVVDPDNIAILGFSDGGSSVISTLFDLEAVSDNWKWQQSFDGVKYYNEIKAPIKKPDTGGFKTGVIYYAGTYHNGYYGNLCKTNDGIYSSYCKILIHLPMNDPLTENAECFINTMNIYGNSPLIYRYENIDHGFDGQTEPQSQVAREITIEYLKSELGN